VKSNKAFTPRRQLEEFNPSLDKDDLWIQMDKVRRDKIEKSNLREREIKNG
jgi:hypothetical protein